VRVDEPAVGSVNQGSGHEVHIHSLGIIYRKRLVAPQALVGEVVKTQSGGKHQDEQQKQCLPSHVSRHAWSVCQTGKSRNPEW